MDALCWLSGGQVAFRRGLKGAWRQRRRWLCSASRNSHGADEQEASSFSSSHTPVLLREVLDVFVDRKLEIFVDGTIGAAGHAEAILEATDVKTYFGFDQDASALQLATERLAKFGNRVKLIQSNFRDMRKELARRGYVENVVDGILLDIGVSSMQLDEAERGFSFMRNGILDMRMDQSSGLTAAEVVNLFTEDDLATIFREFGDEPQARRLARNVAEARKVAPIDTTFQLTEALFGRKWKDGNRPQGYPLRSHPSTRVFQALRIYVNEELDALERVLPDAMELLRPGHGRLAVITFHSSEDRIVKNVFKEGALVRGGVRDLTRKPIAPSEEEVEKNARSRSAKLRAVQRVEPGEFPKRRRNRYPQHGHYEDEDF